MAIPTFDDDLKIISKLGDEPGADNGLSPSEFKAKFDEAALLIQNYINKKLLGELNSLIDVQSLLNNILDSTLTQLDKAANAKATGDQLKTKLSLTGGTMTGHVTVLAPTQDNHPATKQYTDAAVNGAKSYADSKGGSGTATLGAAQWADKTQTVTVAGVTEDCILFVSPEPESFVNYGEWGIRCTAQGEGTLTFRCEDVPAGDLNVNVFFWHQEVKQ